MSRVLTFEYAQRSRRQRQGFNAVVFSGEKARDPVIVGVGLGAKRVTILKLTTAVGELKDEGGRELRAIEVPIKRLAVAISDDVGAGERISHEVKGGLLQHRGEEGSKRGPLVDTADQTLSNLIRANRVIDRFEMLQRGMVCGQPSGPVIEVDVVLPLVNERGVVECWSNLRYAPREGCRLQKSLEIEQAVFAKLPTASIDKRLPCVGAKLIERKSLKIDEVLHGDRSVLGVENRREVAAEDGVGRI